MSQLLDGMAVWMIEEEGRWCKIITAVRRRATLLMPGPVRLPYTRAHAVNAWERSPRVRIEAPLSATADALWKATHSIDGIEEATCAR